MHHGVAKGHAFELFMVANHSAMHHENTVVRVEGVLCLAAQRLGGGCGHDDLEGRAGLEGVGYGAIPGFPRLVIPAVVHIERREIRHGENFTCRHVHHHPRGRLGVELADRLLQLFFHDSLHVSVEREPDSQAFFRIELLFARREEALAGGRALVYLDAVESLELLVILPLETADPLVVPVGKPYHLGGEVEIVSLLLLPETHPGRRGFHQVLRHRDRNGTLHPDKAPLAAKLAQVMPPALAEVA